MPSHAGFARARARTTGTIAVRCARDAISGTTPPKMRCTSCERITSEFSVDVVARARRARRPTSRRTTSRCRGYASSDARGQELDLHLRRLHARRAEAGRVDVDEMRQRIGIGNRRPHGLAPTRSSAAECRGPVTSTIAGSKTAVTGRAAAAHRDVDRRGHADAPRRTSTRSAASRSAAGRRARPLRRRPAASRRPGAGRARRCPAHPPRSAGE